MRRAPDHLAFSWIKYDTYDSPAMKFRQTARENGVEAALEAFAVPLKDGTIPEGSVNSVGYHLLWQANGGRGAGVEDQYGGASAVSKCVRQPGRSVHGVGDKPLAIRNYEKSLSLDPQNKNAVTQLKKLRESSE